MARKCLATFALIVILMTLPEDTSTSTNADSQCCPLGRPLGELDCETLAAWVRCNGVAWRPQRNDDGACTLEPEEFSRLDARGLQRAGLKPGEAERVLGCREGPTTGAIYVLWDVAHVARASDMVVLANSVRSIRRLEEGAALGIMVFIVPGMSGGSPTDALRAVDETTADVLEAMRVDVRELPSHAAVERTTGLKLIALLHTPFSRTLLLDADTFLCARSLRTLFALTARFDFAATHAPFLFHEGRPPRAADGVWPPELVHPFSYAVARWRRVCARRISPAARHASAGNAALVAQR